jgi:hypothetical protein
MEQLMDFGLNPYQWILSAHRNNEAEFSHIDDPDLKFKMVMHFSDPAQIVSLEWIV